MGRQTKVVNPLGEIDISGIHNIFLLKAVKQHLYICKQSSMLYFLLVAQGAGISVISFFIFKNKCVLLRHEWAKKLYWDLSFLYLPQSLLSLQTHHLYWHSIVIPPTILASMFLPESLPLFSPSSPLSGFCNRFFPHEIHLDH